MRPPELADVPPGPPLRSTASTSARVCRAATTADAPAIPSPTTTTSTVWSKRTSRASSAGTESIAPSLSTIPTSTPSPFGRLRGLAVRLRCGVVELVSDDGLVADDPGVMSRLDDIRVAGTSIVFGAVVVDDMKRARHDHP